MSIDRTVHARGSDGREVVRYDRAGKWWLERPDGTRAPLQLPTAVSEAVVIAWEGGGEIYWNRHGGLRFDADVKKALARQRDSGARFRALTGEVKAS